VDKGSPDRRRTFKQTLTFIRIRPIAWFAKNNGEEEF